MFTGYAFKIWWSLSPPPGNQLVYIDTFLVSLPRLVVCVTFLPSIEILNHTSIDVSNLKFEIGI